MKFKKWVEEKGGAVEVSKLLGVTPSAVRVWLRREGTPKVKTALRIEKLSGLALAQIIKETSRHA